MPARVLIADDEPSVRDAVGYALEQEGFDVTTVPNADYLLKVVLALYIPYTFLSPFIGVFIDRFERRQVLSVSSIPS